MLSISAGSDPRYLTREVGAGAEHYYLRSIGLQGEPPGYWTGDGVADLGLQGEVANEVFEDLYTDFIDPRKRDAMYAQLAAIPHEEGTEEYAKAEKAIRAEARLGNAPKSYEKAFEKRFAQALEKAQASTPGGELSPERVKAIELATRKEAPSAKLYYDLTFSAPKSWSVYHASLQVKAAEAREAGDLEGAGIYTRQAEQVWDCWKAGVQAGLEHMQEEAGYTRAGHHGQKVEGRTSGRYIKADRFIAAAFAQHTSRNDDPQLHVHTAVLNKVRTVDVDPVTGREREVWRAIDGTGLFRHKQAAGHLAERVAEQELERVLGVRVQMRPDGKAREIVGIDQDLRDRFSSRRVAIKAEVAQVAKAYEEKYGAAPSPYLLARMSEDVTLQQRNAKKHDATTREDLLQRWEDFSRTRFRESLTEVPDRVAHESEITDLNARVQGPFDPQEVQRRAIAAVQEAKATWTRPDLIVELNRQLPDALGGLDRHQVRGLLNQLADDALAPAADNGVVCTKAPALVAIPAELQREDGSFVYEPNPQTHDRYATEEHLKTEERLREFAGRRGAPAVPGEVVEEVIARRQLKGEQAAFVRDAATSGRKVDQLVGPAGAGKSFTLAALTEVWESHNGGQVIGLASGQRAAEVLRDEGVENVANISMLLLANRSIAEGRPIRDAEKYRIPQGALVILDENSMTDTDELDQVRALIEAAGAKTVPAGDHRQLGAVGAGGMFAQWVEEAPGVHVLDEVRRFRDTDPATGQKSVRQWEADASLLLREGDTEALGQYELHGRLRGGSAEEMTNRAYQAWLTDHLAGKNPLLIASDNAQVAELSARVRADLVRAGVVAEDGVTLRTGREEHGIETKAGVGDLIQLRRNNRRITAENGSFAVNRTVAQVTGISDNGALMVRLEDGSRMHLPADYVADHVELAYAATVHGAQGRTVGVCHSLVDETTNREALYVMLTRGEGGNFGYVITHRDGQDIKQEDVPHHLATLDGVLQRSGLEKTATKTIEAELERREHLAVLHPVWAGVKDQAAEEKFGRALLQALGEEEYERLTSEESYGSLMRLARHVEEAGFDAETLLVSTARSRELQTAEDHGSVLYWRLERAWQKAERQQVRAEEAEQTAALAAQEKDVLAAIEAAHTQTLDRRTVSDLVDGGTALLHPHQDQLLQQALAVQTGAATLQAGQETGRREADVLAAVQAADTPAADGQQLRDLVEAGTAHPHQDELLRQAMATQTRVPVLHADLDEEARQHGIASLLGAAQSEAADDQAVRDLTDPQVPEVHPYQDELLQQAMAHQQYMGVAHANQDAEVRARQAAEREARWEEMDSYAARTPQLQGDLGRFMNEWAQEMDARTQRLGERVAEQEPQWALDRLGPVPEEPVQRSLWERVAGRVQRFREAHNFSSDKDAIGSAPPRGAVEARADWERARRALGVDEKEADIARASDETLRQMVDRAGREEQWAPPYVGDAMQKAYRAERDFSDQAVQLRINAQTMAQQEAAEHEEKVVGAVHAFQTASGHNEHREALAQAMALQQATTLQAEVDPSQRVLDILDRAESSQNIAETMGERAGQLREVHETREQWAQETQTVRDEADLARAELERRAPEPEEPATGGPADTAPAAAAPAPQPSTQEELEQALEQARQAQQILAERAAERAREQEREAAEPQHAEETDRERRDTAFGYEAEYERVGRDLAAAEHGIEPADSSPAPAAPEPAPEPVPAPPAPQFDHDIDL